MLRRLVIFLVLAGLGYVVYRVRKKLLEDAVPDEPEGWSALAARDPRMGEVRDLRGRLLKLIRRHQTGPERRRLMDDVHRCAEAIAEVVDRRLELASYLAELGADAPAALRERGGRLDAEIDGSIAALRQVYADLLGAVDRVGGDDVDAARQTRDLLDGLQQRARAEREIAAALRDEA